MGLEQYRASVRRWMEAGRPIDEVHDEVIEPLPLSADEKSALWLYAWSYLGVDRQRAEAVAHMERLEALGRAHD